MTCCKIWSGIVTYGLGADYSLPHCHGIQMIARGQVAAGISDPWAEISGIIVMVRRSSNTSGGTATGCCCCFLFSLFSQLSLSFLFPQKPREAIAAERYLDSLLFISIIRGKQVLYSFLYDQHQISPCNNDAL